MARKETISAAAPALPDSESRITRVEDAVYRLAVGMQRSLYTILADPDASPFDKMTAVRAYDREQARIDRAMETIRSAYAECVKGGERS